MSELIGKNVLLIITETEDDELGGIKTVYTTAAEGILAAISNGTAVRTVTPQYAEPETESTTLIHYYFKDGPVIVQPQKATVSIQLTD